MIEINWPWSWLVSPEGGNAALWLIGIGIFVATVTEWVKMVRDALRRRTEKKLAERQLAEFRQQLEDAKGKPLMQVQPTSYFEPLIPVKEIPKSRLV